MENFAVGNHSGRRRTSAIDSTLTFKPRAAALLLDSAACAQSFAF